MTFLKLIIFLQLIAVIVSTNVNIANIEKKILDQIFSPANYDSRIRPRSNNTALSQNLPVTVSVNLFIISLTLANEDKQSYDVAIFLRETWVDERLKFDSINGRIDYITLNSAESIWTPDLFCRNEIKGYLHSVTSPNILVRIYPDGQVLLSRRLNLQILNELNYRKFPFDSQDLQLRLASYAYKADDLLLQWKSSQADAFIQMDLQMPLFSVEKIDTFSDTVKVSSGAYPYLKVQITVARKLNYYLIQVFMPCTMLVIAGYLSFWLDIKFITGRVILSVSTLYTLAIMINTIHSQLPKVSYIKLIDVFTGMSLTFVFSTLIELVVAQAFENCACRNNSANEQNQNEQLKTFNVKHIKQWLKTTHLNKIDAIFRIAYPIAFIFFLILYIIAVFV